MTLRTERIDELTGRRGGFEGWIDGIRERAEAALGRGMPEREAALARGFVLGEDDRIDHGTREDFQRSNLTHLLAVSGENVILLCVLAWPLLALLGLPLRARLVGALCLIAIYVPVTGAGPSIQRAGVMGAAGLIAALADRPRSRWYAVLLAGGDHARDQPAGGRRRRLAAQLRGGDRDHALGEAPGLADLAAGGARIGARQRSGRRSR